ncbi:MAG: phosphate ABC transporter permease subunit PstC [candidate division WOR-3 bacterium]|nr:phosphate ABC transporter permease subunit PstC [candidate division WOR-3 bacterium]
MKFNRRIIETSVKIVLFIIALSALVFLAGIVLVLITQGTPILKYVSLKDFLFGMKWYPTHEEPEFGILPMIYGSVLVTLGALIFATPLGIMCALYIAEVAPMWLKETLKPIIELLAGIPSVIYGLFGALFIAPLIQNLFNLPTGFTALSAAIVLGIMILPTITSIVEDALTAIPKEYSEAALALGATKWETMTKIILPAASSGITTGIILGLGRAIGETMAVLMVAGGSANIAFSLLKPVRTMTATIAAEMAETVMGSEHYHALFGIAIVLFVLTMIFNIIAQHISQRFHKRFTAEK